MGINGGRSSYSLPLTEGRRSAPHQWLLPQFRAALICSTVVTMRLLTVATDSAFSRDDGRLLTRIWNATVTTDPVLLDARPSGRMVNPDGSSGIDDGSSPLITTFAAGRAIGAYTTSDPDASAQLSCRISMLFWLAFRPCIPSNTSLS